MCLPKGAGARVTVSGGISIFPGYQIVNKASSGSDTGKRLSSGAKFRLTAMFGNFLGRTVHLTGTRSPTRGTGHYRADSSDHPRIQPRAWERCSRTEKSCPPSCGIGCFRRR